VYRSLLLLSILALALGCKKGNTKPTSDTEAPEDGPKPGETNVAALPKLQPKAKFKLPIARSTSERSVQLSDDGKILGVACGSGLGKTFTKVWDISGEPKEVGEYDGYAFTLAPSGKFIIATGGFSPGVYEVATKKPVAQLQYSFSHVYFRDDNTLVGTNRSYNFPQATKGKITVWDVKKNAEVSSFDIPDNRFNVALPANGGKEIWLFMSSNKFEVECYDVAAKKLLRTIKPENDTNRPYTSAGIYPSIASDGSVFSADTSKTNIFDATTGKIVGGLPESIFGSDTALLPGGTRYCARANPNGTGLSESDYVIYDWKAKKGLAVVTGHATGQKQPAAAASGDGKTLVSVSKEGEGLIFDISSVK
jgi:WD40 repeat protein